MKLLIYASSNNCKQHILQFWSCMWYLFCSYMFSKADNQKYLSISCSCRRISFGVAWKGNSFVKERGMKFCTQYHNNRAHVKTIVLRHLDFNRAPFCACVAKRSLSDLGKPSNKKHGHRRNVTSHHYFSLLWQFQLSSLDNFHPKITFTTG